MTGDDGKLGRLRDLKVDRQTSRKEIQNSQDPGGWQNYQVQQEGYQNSGGERKEAASSVSSTFRITNP